MSRTIQQQLDIIKQHNRLGLMTHVVMGYPSLAETRDRVLRMIDAGVDIIELQIPFSDPIADGPAITVANHTALENGATVEKCFTLAADLVKQSPIPLQCIGYYNTAFRYGTEQFIQRAAAIGMQGLTFPDIPIDEEPYDHFYSAAQALQLPVIQLVSPVSTPERLQHIAKTAEVMVYCVARLGVTGVNATASAAQLASYLQRVREYVTLPLAVGFGISTPEHIRSLHGLVDVAVMGSALLPLTGAELTTTLQKLCASR